MKRSPIIMALILLLCLTVTPASALETDVTIEGAKATVGEIVYLTVSLEETREADTVGIALTFDRSALEFVASKSTWSIAGTIRNFDRQREYALWADSKGRSLSGELCRLAFRVREGAKASQCSVACSVVLKIDDQEVASYAATGEITLKCRHSYGEWMPVDASAHSRICQLCGSEEYGSHVWDEGTVTKEPTRTQQGARLLTCQLCGAEREESIPKVGSPEETKPAEPSSTQPAEPSSTQPAEPSSTQPEPDRPQSSQPIQTQPDQPQTTQPEPTLPQTTPPQQTGEQGDPSGSGSTTTIPVQSADGNAQDSETLVIPQEDVVVIRPDEAPEESNESDQAAAASDTPETAGETQTAAESKGPAWTGAVLIGGLLIAAAGIGCWMLRRNK